ncbi:MAG: hypothetical protein WDZ27_05925 [Waddliaceae bacterium]
MSKDIEGGVGKRGCVLNADKIAVVEKRVPFALFSFHKLMCHLA